MTPFEISEWFSLPKDARREAGVSFSMLVPASFSDALRREARIRDKSMAQLLVEWASPHLDGRQAGPWGAARGEGRAPWTR